MEVIVPAAGLSTRFPGMQPKYTLMDHEHKFMLERSIENYLGKVPITVGILREHNAKFPIASYLETKYPGQIKFVILDKQTQRPADTVRQIIEESSMDLEKSILIKDCDSFFKHTDTDGNYVCISEIGDHEILKRLSSKSFVRSNDQNIITDIMEKQVISDKFCVGGYRFDSARMFCESFDSIEMVTEIFTSHVIQQCLTQGEIFTTNKVSNYIDVGTKEDWLEYIK
jgi:hypothetical protein